jgi:copper chaperone NosL
VRNLLDTFNRHLDARLDVAPRVLLVIAAAFMALTLTQPLWNMTMFAPQYPDGLRMDIYSYQLQGGRNGQDVKEINVLNHYIGMRDLSTEDFTEFKWMPFAIGILALLMLRSAVHGSMSSLVDSVVLFVYFGGFSLWSFAHKMYVYGHNLTPGAPVKVPPFSPPIFGYQQIANFEVYSYPRLGTYLMLAAGLALVTALALAWRAGTETAKRRSPATAPRYA